MCSSVTAAKQDGVSKYLDQVFDSAFNETSYANDLPNIRWGRIDYLNVTHITTKWGIWQYVLARSLSEHNLTMVLFIDHLTSSYYQTGVKPCGSIRPIKYA